MFRWIGLIVLAQCMLPMLAQNYTVTNLPTLGGTNPSGATAISSSGQVVGYGNTAGNQQHAFSWTQGGGIVDLGTLGGFHSAAIGVNSSGQVTGYANTPDNRYHAFLWAAPGPMVDLGTLGGTYSYGAGIDTLGQVVGWSYTVGSTNPHAFLWTQADGMVDLGTLGGTESYATGISSLGQVVGYSRIPGNLSYHAFLWTQAGGMVDLGTLGGSYSYATGINSLGQVMGESYTAGNSAYHAFSWTQAGGMVDLGTLGGSYSYPRGINSSGQVAGGSHPPGNSTYHAFLWSSPGPMADLGTLGGTYSWAFAINVSGQVVGYSQISGNSAHHAFLWTQAEGMVDLNTRIPTAPPGIQLGNAQLISDTGLIVANSNVGDVVLGAISNAPVVGPISANDPVEKGTPLSVAANFTDADTSDTHTAVWTWGDGSSESGTVSESAGSGTVSGSHAFLAAGVYTVSLQVTDSNGLETEVSRDVVVYDPSAGFVTGGGWFISPPGAFLNNTSAVGRATFGFVSKYAKGATQPTGNTEFQFQAANLNFHSENYDWLVVAGARAQYKGTGTINGQGAYKFMLTAVDGDLLGAQKADRFRIKIWYYDTALERDVVVYDNQTDGSTTGTYSEGTLLGGGSIVIHQ